MFNNRTIFIAAFAVYTTYVCFLLLNETAPSSAIIRLPANTAGHYDSAFDISSRKLISQYQGAIDLKSQVDSLDPNEPISKVITEGNIGPQVIGLEKKSTTNNMSDLNDVIQNVIKDNHVSVSVEKDGNLETIRIGALQNFPVSSIFFLLGLLMMKPNKIMKAPKRIQGEWHFTIGRLNLEKKWNLSHANSYTKIKLSVEGRDSPNKNTG